MAGGLGTRLRPLTESTPKPMIPVQGRPILEFLIEQLASQGFRHILISVNYLSHVIENHFGDGSKWGLNITYLYEREPMGTGGALALVPEKPACATLVLNGDILTRVDFANLIQTHEAKSADMTICVAQYEYEIPFGVINASEERLLSIDEKPKDRRLVNAGVYVIAPDVFDYVAGGRLDMPELIDICLSKKLHVSVFAVHEYWRDIGRKADLEIAQKDFGDASK